VQVLFYPKLIDLRYSIVFREVPRLRVFVLLVTVICRWRWVWSTRGRIL